jgi:hypothetical protein
MDVDTVDSTELTLRRTKVDAVTMPMTMPVVVSAALCK